MTEINKIQSANAVNSSSTDTKKHEIRPNNMNTPNDSVEISGMSTKKKIGIGAAVLTLITTAGSLAYMIGRNPASAAKVIKGHSNFANEAYQKGTKLADDIMQKQGEFTSKLDDVLKLFEQPQHKTNFHEIIARTEKQLAENNVVLDETTGKALTNIKKRLEQHCNSVEQNFLSGKKFDEYKLGEEFVRASSDDLQTVSEFLKKQKNSELWQRNFDFSSHNVGYNVQTNSWIGNCPKEVLPNDGVLFHGTKNSGKVYKDGFSNFASNQLENSQRELGAGVYTTPDVGVAAYFSGLHGAIIPVKLTPESKIAVVTEKAHGQITQQLNNFISERVVAEEFKNLPPDVRNATCEIIMQRFFKEAGYDAAYIPTGVKGGGLFANIFGGNINEAIGRNQSQVVIFKPENLTIVSRGLKDRVCDLKSKFNGIINQIKYQNEHPFGI